MIFPNSLQTNRHNHCWKRPGRLSTQQYTCTQSPPPVGFAYFWWTNGKLAACKAKDWKYWLFLGFLEHPVYAVCTSQPTLIKPVSSKYTHTHTHNILHLNRSTRNSILKWWKIVNSVSDPRQICIGSGANLSGQTGSRSMSFSRTDQDPDPDPDPDTFVLKICHLFYDDFE